MDQHELQAAIDEPHRGMCNLAAKLGLHAFDCLDVGSSFRKIVLCRTPETEDGSGDRRLGQQRYVRMMAREVLQLPFGAEQDHAPFLPVHGHRAVRSQ